MNAGFVLGYLLAGLASCAVFCSVVPDRVERNPSILLGSMVFGPFVAVTIFVGMVFLLVRHIPQMVRRASAIRNARKLARKLGVELP